MSCAGRHGAGSWASAESGQRFLLQSIPAASNICRVPPTEPEHGAEPGDTDAARHRRQDQPAGMPGGSRWDGMSPGKGKTKTPAKPSTERGKQREMPLQSRAEQGGTVGRRISRTTSSLHREVSDGEPGTLAVMGELPAVPPGRHSPSELCSRHRCKLAAFSFIKQSCHCFNCSPEASTLQRSVLQSDASKGSDAPAPPAPQLIILRRGRSDRSQRRPPARSPAPLLLSLPSSSPALTPHTPHASTWKTLCSPPPNPRVRPPDSPCPAPASAAPPSHAPAMHTLLPFL